MDYTRRHRTVIPESAAGMRLDRALASLFEDYSRTNIKSWIEQGRVRVNDRLPKPRDRVSAGDEIDLRAIFSAADGPLPQAVDYGVVFEDEAMLVIDKPAGLVVHPGAGNPAQTLVNGLLHRYPDLEPLPRAGLIHRLDKETSGLLIVARTPRVYQVLTRQMSERAIRRCYDALVNGVMVAGGTVEAAIGRDRHHRTRMAVSANGRPATTHHRVRQRYRAHTRIELQLETGRTHQIRVHMAHLGFPVIGDGRYGGRRVLPPDPDPGLVAALGALGRHALHARTLTLRHPLNAEERTFEAPLPDDLGQLVAALATDLQNSRARS